MLLTMSNRRRLKPEPVLPAPPISHPGSPFPHLRDQPIDLDKVRSVGWQRRSSQTNGQLTKVTTDDNRATITEHWSGDRQDVTVRPKPVRMGVTTTS